MDREELELIICGTELTRGLVTITDVKTNNFNIVKDIDALLNWIRRADIKEVDLNKFLVDKHYLLEV